MVYLLKNGDFLWLCQITRWYIYIFNIYIYISSISILSGQIQCLQHQKHPVATGDDFFKRPIHRMAVLGKEILVDLTVLERRDGETNPTTSPTKQTQTNLRTNKCRFCSRLVNKPSNLRVLLTHPMCGPLRC